MQAGPDWGGGIQDLMQQFMLYRMISQMYPDDKKKKKGEKETLRGMPKIGEMFLGESELPPAREIPTGEIGQIPLPPAREMPPELSMMQPPMGQPPMGQQQQPDIQQIMQMLQMFGGLPGGMR